MALLSEDAFGCKEISFMAIYASIGFFYNPCCELTRSMHEDSSLYLQSIRCLLKDNIFFLVEPEVWVVYVLSMGIKPIYGSLECYS